MAKFTIDLDTETKDAAININGRSTKVDDISIMIYRDEKGKPTGFDVKFETKEYVEGITKVTTYYAYGSEKLKEEGIAANVVYNNDELGCAQVKNIAPLINDIVKYLRK